MTQKTIRLNWNKKWIVVFAIETKEEHTFSIVETNCNVSYYYLVDFQ